MLKSRNRCAREAGDDDRSGSRIVVDVPFEFVGKVAGARAVAEASDVEGGAAAARHREQAGGRLNTAVREDAVDVASGVPGVWRSRVVRRSDRNRKAGGNAKSLM